MGQYITLGFQMVVVTMIITWVGYWLDQRRAGGPFYLFIFFVLGALAGMIVVWRALQRDGDPRRR